MAHRVVRTTSQNWLSRLLGSVVGVLIGIGLFLGSFFVLWTNEGRTDLSKIADDSIAVAAARVDPANEGKLVAAAGTLSADAPVGDPDYLREGNYLMVERSVEMYAWVERSESRSQRNTGGSETTTTEYTYVKEWTSNPPNSNNFELSQGHANPELTIEEATFTADSAQVGAFGVDLGAMRLPSTEPLPLRSGDLVAGAQGTVSDNTLFIGRGTLQSPQVGDVRIRFLAVPGDIDVTAFGEQRGSALVPYVRGDDTLYLAHDGDRAAAIEMLHTEYQVMGWIFRAVGFIMMWIGLSLVGGPLSTVLDVLPIFGTVSRTLIGVLAFVIALVLSAITIVISMIMHNIIALIIILLLVGAGGFYLYARSRKSATATPKMA